jgi:phosphoglucomutase/phosphomannomutase
MNVDRIEQMDFDEAVAGGRIVLCKEEVDAAFQTEVRAQSFAGPRELKILYSPLHGVGESAVCPVLKADGFDNVEVFTDHREPSGDFPNVPGHVSNPENAAVFTAIIQHAQATGAELILATDPDCDRVGCAAPVSADLSSDWATFTGNQIGALLAEYVLEQRKMAGTLSPRHYLVKTLVTTELIRRIGDSYGVKTYGDLLVGFKWIGQLLDQKGPDEFVLGAEESHGYLVGQYVRDKDASVACMLLAELAACIKSQGKTLHEKLDALFWQHGYHAEKLVNVQMEGSEGMTLMQSLMTRFRQQPPQTLAGIPVAGVRDYLNQVNRRSDGTSPPITEPVERENMLIFDLVEPGNYVAVRPSGTEPKIKYYMFTFVPAEQLADLELAKQEMADRLKKFESDLRAF